MGNVYLCKGSFVYFELTPAQELFLARKSLLLSATFSDGLVSLFLQCHSAWVLGLKLIS